MFILPAHFHYILHQNCSYATLLPPTGNQNNYYTKCCQSDMLLSPTHKKNHMQINVNRKSKELWDVIPW